MKMYNKKCALMRISKWMLGILTWDKKKQILWIQKILNKASIEFN